MKEVKTFCVDETINVGKTLGKLLRKGDIVCITGDLGTGKTVITNGIAQSIGISDHITSPTFTIVNEYRGDLDLFHFDVYRISDPEEMFEIGFEEYLNADGIVIIEWADLIKDIIPKEHIWINITKDLNTSIDARIIKIEFNGPKYKDHEIMLEL